MQHRLFSALADAMLRFRWWVLALWIAAVAAGASVASRVPGILEGGSGDLPGTRSAEVARTLARDFDSPFRQVVVVTLSSEARIPDDRIRSVAKALRASPAVRRVLGPTDPGGGNLKSPEGTRAALIVGLNADSPREAERAVPIVRAALETFRRPDIRPALTGKAPMMVDMNALSERDASTAEARVLPLTLLILLFAFGSLVAAGLPLIMGVVTTLVTMGLVFVVGQFLGLSTLVQTVVTMVGLGVGIDYSLVLVKRFREALEVGLEVPEAVRHAVVTGGTAIAWSGVAVLIGLGSLLFTPLLETRSIGLGGILVVLMSLGAGLTLLPVLLSLLGRRVDAGTWIVRPQAKAAARRIWERWAHRVMDRPIPVLLAGTAILLALAWPALGMKQGFPSGKWLPPEMESVQGFAALEEMDQGLLYAPMDVVVRSTAGPVLAARHLPALKRLGDRLAADPRVRHVRSPLHLVPGMTLGQAYLLYADVDRAIARFPAIAEFFLSRDRTQALFTVIPASRADLADMQALAREVGTWDVGPGLAVSVGGWGAYYNDFDAAMARTYPRVIAFVLVATFLVLFVAYRSFLVPSKAIVMNLLSVGAGYGVVVLIFQHGFGARLVGLDRALGAVPAVVPILLFCLLFGLSMDYEVFLLSRIREAVEAGMDNRGAVALGLATTGGMITSAALVMAIVFGAFAFAQVAIVKMLGMGLAVAVLVDATIVRALLVPALMRIAGGWNWYPGLRALPAAAAPET